MHRRVTPRNERGSVLVGSLVVVVVMIIGAAAFLSHTSTEVLQVKQNIGSIRSFYYAEAGLSYAQGQLLRGWKLASLANPFDFIDNRTMTTLPAEMTVRAGTPEEGRFRVEIVGVSAPHNGARDLTVRSTGTYREESRTAMATFCLELKPSRAFDYGYFLNHSGWLEGMPQSFRMYGNLRASGSLSLFNSSLSLNGNPESKGMRGQRYYKDSGGIYSGVGIIDAALLTGMGSLPENQHAYEDSNANGELDPGEDHNEDGRLTRPEQLGMPNLTDLSPYEDQARNWNGGAGSSIRIEGAGAGGTDLQVSNAIYGDEAGEKGNLILWGTQQNPIVIEGPIVVRGALIIKGYVRGKGSIYVGHNIYIPDNLLYVNPPVGRPNWSYSDYSSEEERYQGWKQAVSQWQQENADKDGLGLFARENVLVGDFQDTSWRSDVETWLDHPANESDEAASGLDHLPNTNDPGENDGIWTVDRYTESDLNAGLIPTGKNVGEVVPGSGEDIDGDAAQDGRIWLSAFDLPAPVDAINWGGWTPLSDGSAADNPGGGSGKGGGSGRGGGSGKGGGSGRGGGSGKGGDRPGKPSPGGSGWPTSFSDFFNAAGGDALDYIDALIYSNQAVAANWGRGSAELHLLGGIVCRVGAVIFRNDGSALWIHDERFTGGGEAFGFVVPWVKKPIQIIHWAEVPSDYAPGGG